MMVWKLYLLIKNREITLQNRQVWIYRFLSTGLHKEKAPFMKKRLPNTHYINNEFNVRSIFFKNPWKLACSNHYIYMVIQQLLLLGKTMKHWILGFTVLELGRYKQSFGFSYCCPLTSLLLQHLSILTLVIFYTDNLNISDNIESLSWSLQSLKKWIISSQALMTTLLYV